MNKLTSEQKNRIADHLADRLQAYAVILFGSAAKERMHSGSDVDIAFMSDRSFPAYDVFMVAQELSELLGREVDLVDFRQASTVFKAQIVGYGVVLRDSEPVKRQVAFMRALKEYAQLNEERKPILEKIR